MNPGKISINQTRKQFRKELRNRNTRLLPQLDALRSKFGSL
ncbi:MAG: hypothetical protein ACFFD4_00255 [Candidatus Odinarchaeota archaeon]